jgi:hypothetical protein
LPRLRLFSRDYCHLCHDMLAALEALRGEAWPFRDRGLDVDADPELEAKYNELVPVLVDGEGRNSAITSSMPRKCVSIWQLPLKSDPCFQVSKLLKV